MNATDNAAVTVTLDGRKWTLTTYVDPYPNNHGDDRVDVGACGRCGGTGIYTGPSGLKFAVGTRRGAVVNTWCFDCNGSGRSIMRVSVARRQAKVDAVWREHGDTIRAETAAKQAEAWAAQAAKEFAEHWDEAHAEQARRAALVTGFVADVGEKVDAIGTVDVATSFEVPSYRGFGSDWKAMVVVTLADGRVVKTSGTGRSLFNVERGDRVRIRGTVKAHGNYRGQDQTVLTRAKVDTVE